MAYGMAKIVAAYGRLPSPVPCTLHYTGILIYNRFK